jgi:uncharacterized membrane protein
MVAALLLSACQPKADDGTLAAEPASAPAAAAAVAPAAAPAVPPEFAGELQARGAEPFWSVRIGKDGLVLQRPDRPAQAFVNPGPKMAGDAVVWEGAIAIALRKADCSDGMSDTAYPMTAEVKVGAETLKGCARPAPK